MDFLIKSKTWFKENCNKPKEFTDSWTCGNKGISYRLIGTVQLNVEIRSANSKQYINRNGFVIDPIFIEREIFKDTDSMYFI